MAQLFRTWLLVLPLLLLFVSACQTTAPSHSSVPTPDAVKSSNSSNSIPTARLRDNAYSLLYELLNDEKQVSKILLIKRERDELDRLITTIAQVNGAGAEQLKKFAHSDPTLVLRATSLPEGERATRTAVAETKKKELLGSSGLTFERRLLLTQLEALNYGSHLAGVAAKADTNPERSSYLNSLSTTLKDLYSRAYQMLLSPETPRAEVHDPPKDPQIGRK